MKRIIPEKRRAWLDRAESYTKIFIKRTKYILPHVARFCLVSTFIEDGIRMWMFWHGQRSYMTAVWNTGWWIGTLFVIMNICALLIPSILILARKKIGIACGILIFSIVVQSIALKTIWIPRLMLRSLGFVGGLFLLMAESRIEARSLFAGVPTIKSNARKNYMQLAGRILLAIMFLNIVRYDLSFRSTVRNSIEGICILFIAVGFKAKFFALILAFYLVYVSFTEHNFWSSRDYPFSFHYLRREFFQTMSVVGGLLFVVAHGPGGVSIDERKKQ